MIVIYVLWTIDSFVVLASGWVTPTSFGYGFVVFQLIGGAGFALLEYVGLGRMTTKREARQN